jgi:hypothetical protein
VAERRLANDLEEALAVVERESPLHHAEMARCLGPLAAVIRVGGDAPMRVSLAEGLPRVSARGDGQIHVALTEPVLERLLRGELTLDDGVVDGSISARGELEHVLAWFDALGAWLHGALRSPSLPHLHQRFLAPVLADGRKGERP